MWAFHLNRDLAVLQMCIYFSCLEETIGSGIFNLAGNERSEFPVDLSLLFELNLFSQNHGFGN
jgi:hypothetical protein